MVTGGAGFIGSCFIRKVLRESPSTRVLNLDKLTYAGCQASIPNPPQDRYQLCIGDIADAAVVEQRLVDFAPEWIVHFAAETHVDRSIDSPAPFIQTNVVGTFQLLESTYRWWRTLPEHTRQGFRFLHVSTDEVYGSLSSSGMFTEQSPFQPNSPYSASKASSNHLVRSYHRTFGLPVVTTNCSNNFGPYQSPEKLIPLVTLRAMQGEPIPVYGSGENVRDWIFVEDNCEAIARIVASGKVGETYNVGGGNEWTNLQVVETICDLVDTFADRAHAAVRNPWSSRALIEHVSDRPGHDLRYAVDAAKLRAELGWQPKLPFADALKQTVLWYLNNPQWVASALERSDCLRRRGDAATRENPS